ncbi:MAG: SBBP repeat-containing protein [Ignavibacteria bacterium]|nr:SBBP repeat-containing protein [Ignavibacteria bacterium]
MKHKILAFLLSVFTIHVISQNSFAQVQQEWVSWYSGPGSSDDRPSAIAVDSSGNVYSVGYNSNSPIYGFLIIKYNPAGQQLWAKVQTITPPTTLPVAKRVGIDRQQNVIVAGDDIEWRIFKYDPSGNLLWQQRYQYGLVNSLAIDDSSNIYVCGSGSGSGSSTDFVVIKYNPQGVQQWLAYYDSGRYDYPASMYMDKNKNIYVTGESANSQNNQDFLTVKFDSTGTLKWSNRYISPYNNSTLPISVTSDFNGNCFATGVLSHPTQGYNYFTIKYSSLGDTLWTSSYTSISDNSLDHPFKIAADNLGNAIVMGRSRFMERDSYGTIKYDQIGNLLWVNHLPGFPADMKLDGENNIYVSGAAYYVNNGHPVNSMGTVKYDQAGIQKWIKYWNGPADSNDVFGVSMTIDFNKNVYVLGRGSLTASYFDMVTIKYSQLIGIEPIGTTIATEYKLHQNYPNPFNPNTIIKYEIIKNNSQVNLSVFDITGRGLTVLVDEKQNNGVYEIKFNANSFSSGVYFYRLTVNGNIVDTRKMILVK